MVSSGHQPQVAALSLATQVSRFPSWLGHPLVAQWHDAWLPRRAGEISGRCRAVGLFSVVYDVKGAGGN